MTEGNTQDDDQGKNGPDLFAIPGYQPYQPEPVWPGQKPDQPSSDKQNKKPNPNPNPNQSPLHSPSTERQNEEGEEREIRPRLAFPEAAPQLQLPSKPKIKTKPNLAPGISQPQPGEEKPSSITAAPALPKAAQTNPSFVPTNRGAPQVTIGPAQKTGQKPSTPIITSASAKPDWTQPQWPEGRGPESQQTAGSGPVVGRQTGGTGSKLPPAFFPLPQAPYSQAPPSSGNVRRSLFGDQHRDNPTQNQRDLNYANQSQAHQGLRSQLPFTIRRDFALTKQLFGDQANRLVTKERHEYKQTEYIPKAPTLKVPARDPDRPWSPAPAATYEFFAEEEDKGKANPQNSIHTMGQPGQPKQEVQFARGFNPENLQDFEQGEGEGQPDPRYSPFQGELVQDIARQDKRAGRMEEPIPAEKRERGAAALRALGRNSDKFYDSLNPNNQQTELPTTVRLNSRDLFGLVTYYFIVTKEVLTSPQIFFANMSLVGGLNDPLLYLAFTAVMTGIFAALAKLNLLLFFMASIWGFVSVALSAVIMQFTFKKLGSQGKFEQTFNVLAYSKATFIFAWICLGPLPIGAILANIFTAYLNYLGLSRVHKLPTTTIWLVIGVMAAIPLIFKIAGH